MFLNDRTGAGHEEPASGKFRFSVRLEDIFGFAADYNRVMYGFIHILTFIRNLNHKDALFGTNAATVGKVVFSKISWILPIVEPSQVAGYELVKLINEQCTSFRGHSQRTSGQNRDFQTPPSPVCPGLSESL